MKEETTKQELRDRIIQVAFGLFRKHGISSVKMDTIASSLSISKRTLYENFENKELLLLECVKRNRDLRNERMEQIVRSSSNVLEVIMGFYRLTVEHFQSINPLMFSEVAKYQKVVDLIEEGKVEKRRKSVEFFHKGVEEGLFRPEVNYDIFMLLCNEGVQFMMNSENWQTYSLLDIYESLITVNVRGVCTPKGIALFEKLMKDNKDIKNIKNER